MQGVKRSSREYRRRADPRRRVMPSPNPVARTQQETADHLGVHYSTISRGYACMRAGNGEEGIHDSKT
jgi:hypothetical protein